MQSFHAVTGVSSALVDLDHNVLATTSWLALCAQFHWAHPQIDEQCWRHQSNRHDYPPDQSFVCHYCINGLREYAVPVRIEGQHVATFFLGQFLHEPPNEDSFLRLAHKFGFDEAKYLQALRQVPIVSEERAKTLVRFFIQITQSWVEHCVEHRHLQQTRAALQESEERVRRLSDDSEMRIHERTRELTRAQKHTAQVLNALRVASSSLELDAVLESIAEVMASAIGAPFCCIFFIDPERNRLIPRAVGGWQARDYFDESDKRLLEFELDPYLEEVLERKEPLTAFDFESSPEISQKAGLAFDYKSLLAVPLRSGEQILGVAVLITQKARDGFSQDELELVRGIANSVALGVDNARLYEETRRRLAETEGLSRLAKGFLEKIGLPEILEIVCVEAKNLTGARGSAVLLLDEDGWLRVTHHLGKPEPALERVPFKWTIAGREVYTDEPVLINHGDSDDQWLPGLTSLLSVPLKTDTKVIGALDVMNKTGGFNQDDVRIITLFAYQAAINIEHARLHHQAEQLAVLEERQRLARELHDSVTQALYSVTLYADATRLALSNGQDEAASKNLQELRKVVREAMFDMRLLIYELHPLALEKEGLVAALRARLSSVEERAGFAAKISVEGERRVPLPIEEELYRIAQEGLNNVVKHAKSQNVEIHLRYDEHAVSLTLEDDGIGFDADDAKQGGGLGLRGMQERVRRMGGELELASIPGKGTRLQVAIPF
ncbi:MAG: GAF domain-containing protein [Chloroflexi bacterium]|nr:GAF domain-containing protein [Chloroflexota bacterium]